MSRGVEDSRFVVGLRTLALGAAAAVVWPGYLLLLAYLARQAPWSRGLSFLVAAVLIGVALAVFAHDLLRWMARPSGWAERYLGMAAPVARQLGRAGRFLVVAAAVLLLPAWLIDSGLIAPEGRLISAPAFSRLLILAFELAVWGVSVRLLTGRSPMLASLAAVLGSGTDEPSTGGSWLRGGLKWVRRHRRAVATLPIAGIGAVIVLDVFGYSFSARRLAMAGTQTATVVMVALAAYRAMARLIDGHVGSWARAHPPRRRSWAAALTSAMSRRGPSRSPRGAGLPAPAPESGSNADDPAATVPRPEDLAAGLRRLVGSGVALLGFLAVAWLWELDLAFLRFLLNQPLWSVDEQTLVTVGDLIQASVIVVAGVLAWRYMGTIFALTLFHRMPDDPGVRFAVVMLCRYAVLVVASIAALGAIRLDMARIGVVLAALGVGLGFGLQEIVSNFVCGIILLLERPIRIGDVVTVAETTGRVDRIHIRATTIVNAENQSMIVPNREFITGKLVNWTHNDKILRVTVRLMVEYGTDPDRAAELLISTARRDPDVVINPAPSAMMEGFGESGLTFVLHAFVPDPALIGPVRHRLCVEIQRRLDEAGIRIPVPIREVRLLGAAAASSVPEDHPVRRDAAATLPAGPHARGVVGRVEERA